MSGNGGKTRSCAAARALAGLVAITGLVLVLAPDVARAHGDEIVLDVTAELPARCGLSPSGVAAPDAAADLEKAASLSIRVALDCNTPYAIGVTAVEGALVNTDRTEDGSGYGFRKSYGVKVSLDTDLGAVHSGRCTSGDMVAGGACPFSSTVEGGGLSSGDGISVGRDAVISIDWPDQSQLPRRLAPGRYRDTLLIVVGARA